MWPTFHQARKKGLNTLEPIYPLPSTTFYYHNTLYLYVGVRNVFNLIFQTFISQNFFISTSWINFVHLFISFTHIHFHYIFQMFLNFKILQPFHSNLIHDRKILWEECCLLQLIFALTILQQQFILLVFFLHEWMIHT